MQLRLVGLPDPEPEVRFWPGRRFAFDWAWKAEMIALEFEGGVYSAGWHQSVERYLTDCLKYGRAAVMGWIVVRVAASMVRDGTALGLVQEAFEYRLRHPVGTESERVV